MRGVVESVFLVGHERNPVERVVGEERVPFLIATRVEQVRFVHDKLDQLLARGFGGSHHMVSVMRSAHARYWLRIGSSLVPPVVISPPRNSDGS